MSELTMERLRENLESLKMKNTLEILDNYLEQSRCRCPSSPSRNRWKILISASSPPLTNGRSMNSPPSLSRKHENIVFLGPPGVGKTHLASALGMAAARHRISTYYINCHQLIEQLKKAHFENRQPDKLKILGKYKLLIIDEICYLPMDIQGANLFFQLIARRYEKTSTVFTSNKTFSQWNEVFADVTIASAILDRVLHHCTVVNIKGESYRLKERKEFMKQKQQIVNTLFEQAQP